MKHLLSICLLVFISMNGFGQLDNQGVKNNNKGKLYFYWGWNGSSYTKSNINFKGESYDFTLRKVIANDRQSEFSFNTYLNPLNATIPQYNFRVGYYLNENWDVSIGVDHMKYVVFEDQSVYIEGFIENTNPTYDNIYSEQEIQLTKDFLTFEHTDGLNYVNVEVRHSNRLNNHEKVSINFIQGMGVGLMIPRTNTTLLGKMSYDEFHLSGYGFDGLIGLKISFFNKFFIQSELKGGFVNLPNVRTTASVSDEASHHFFFTQHNIVFGAAIEIGSKSKKSKS